MNPRYLYQEIVKRKSRTAEIIVTIAVLVGLVISVSAILDAYSTAVYAPFRNVGADLILQKGSTMTADTSSPVRAPFGKAVFTPDEIRAIASLRHVRNMSESLVVWSFRKDGFSSVEGIDPASPLGINLKSWVSDGSFLSPEQPGTVILESHYAKFNHKAVGDTVELGGESFRVTGIIKVMEGSQVFSSNMIVNLPDAERISHINGTNQIYLGLDDVAQEGAVRDGISGIDRQIIIYSGNTLTSSLGDIAGIFRQFYLIVIGLVTAIAVMIVGKMSIAGLLEKQRDIGVLQSVGWTRKDIMVQLTAEFSLKVIIGCVIGVLAAMTFAATLGAVAVQARPTGLEEPVAISAPLVISPVIALGYSVLVFCIALAVFAFMCRRMVSRKPGENLRSV